ncbi:hypothetical protein [Pseudomonas sp. 28 E 9]|nr:hypothetical protein [Pseudomonas sp. 28 E 9]
MTQPCLKEVQGYPLEGQSVTFCSGADVADHLNGVNTRMPSENQTA